MSSRLSSPQDIHFPASLCHLWQVLHWCNVTSVLIPWVISEALARQEAQVFAELGAIGIPHWQHRTCTNLFIEISTVASAVAWGPSIVQKFRVGRRASMPNAVFQILCKEFQKRIQSTVCIETLEEILLESTRKKGKSEIGRFVLSYFWMAMARHERSFFVRLGYVSIVCKV